MNKKWIKRLLILLIAIIVSFAGQTGVILFARSQYLNKNLDVKFKDIPVDKEINDDKKVTIPENVDYIIPSNNGRYLLYVVGSKAHVVNIEDGTDNTLDITVDGDNTNFCWHDLEEKLIISQTNEDGILGLRMYNYNPRVGTVERALDYNNQERTYSVGNYNQRVKDIKINNVNTILYLKLANESRSNIYRLDISGDLYKIELMSNNIGNYAILKDLDNIVYEEANKGNLYISDKSVSKLIKIDGVDQIKLVGIYNNILYVAAMENGLAKSIYSTDLSEGYDSNTAQWDKIDLHTPTEIKNIVISRLGNLYYNDNENKTVINLKTDKKTKYKGEFIGIYKDKLISQDGTTIYRKTIK